MRTLFNVDTAAGNAASGNATVGDSAAEDAAAGGAAAGGAAAEGAAAGLAGNNTLYLYGDASYFPNYGVICPYTSRRITPRQDAANIELSSA